MKEFNKIQATNFQQIHEAIEEEFLMAHLDPINKQFYLYHPRASTELHRYICLHFPRRIRNEANRDHKILIHGRTTD